jgi:hypothetical protein
MMIEAQSCTRHPLFIACESSQCQAAAGRCCQYRDVAVARSISDRLQKTPDKRFASMSELSGMV